MSGVNPASRLTPPVAPTGTTAPSAPAVPEGAKAGAASDALALSGSYYTGTSAGYRINWTAKDIAATPASAPSQPGYSLFKENSDSFNAPPEEGDIFGGDASLDVTAKLRSVVGPYLAFESTSAGYAEGAAHGWANSTLTTVDVRSGKPVELTELFDKKDIYKAMMKDLIVKQMLGSAKPKNFEEMVNALQYKEAKDGRFIFDELIYQHFAIHHVEKGKVAVRLAIPYGAEVFRGELTQLGLLLPIPAELKGPLSAAAAKKEGILWSDLGKTTKGKQTAMSFERAGTAPAAEE